MGHPLNAARDAFFAEYDKHRDDSREEADAMIAVLRTGWVLAKEEDVLTDEGRAAIAALVDALGYSRSGVMHELNADHLNRLVTPEQVALARRMAVKRDG